MNIFGYKLCIFLDAYNFVGLKTDKNDKIIKNPIKKGEKHEKAYLQDNNFAV